MAAVYVGLDGQGGKWCHRLVDFGFWHKCVSLCRLFAWFLFPGPSLGLYIWRVGRVLQFESLDLMNYYKMNQ